MRLPGACSFRIESVIQVLDSAFHLGRIRGPVTTSKTPSMKDLREVRASSRGHVDCFSDSAERRSLPGPPSMTQRRTKNALVVLAGLAFAALGIYNIVLKATFAPMDDGVFWTASPQGLVASRVAPGGPGAPASACARATSCSPWTARRSSAPSGSRRRSRRAGPASGSSTRSCARTSGVRCRWRFSRCGRETSARSTTFRSPASSAWSSAPWSCCAGPPTGPRCTSTRCACCSS